MPRLVRSALSHVAHSLTETELVCLRSAQGWSELGLAAEALVELDNIEPRQRTHPEVLEIRWNIYISAERWAEAVEVAHTITRIAPEQFNGWWMLSFALHEMEQTEAAYDNLASVRHKFGAEWMTHYNLACYLSRLGRLNEARASLRRALQIDPFQRAEALKDTDLEPLWREIQQYQFTNGSQTEEVPDRKNAHW